MIKIPISNGELADKISILKIKSEKVHDKNKLSNICAELSNLLPLMESVGITTESDSYKELYRINLELWNIEDKIRLKEKQKIFDEEFIKLARQIYTLNDERARLKKKIDIETKSELTEEKSYEKYN